MIKKNSTGDMKFIIISTILCVENRIEESKAASSIIRD